MKPVKRIAGILSISALCFFTLCTIKDDNGSLVSTGPHTPGTTGTHTTVTNPYLLITPDNSFAGIGETLSVSITVYKDSTLTQTVPNMTVECYANRGWISAESLVTDSKGRAVLTVLDTAKSRMEINISCANTSQTLRIDITDTPDLIQKLLTVVPERAVLKADGKDNTTIQVMLKNENNNPVSGQCVQFITSAGLISGGTQTGCTGLGQVSTDAQGIARATLTSVSVNDTAFITVFLVSDRTTTATTRVVFKGVTILLTVDSTNLKPGANATISAFCVNASNDPIPYLPVFFVLGKDTASNLSFVSKDTVSGPDGNARCVISGSTTGTDSVRIFAAGAAASVKINVTDLLLTILLDDNVLQARVSKSTVLHVSFSGSSGNPLSGKDVKVKRTFQTTDGKDTSDFLLSRTDAQGKSSITINALPYECTMALEVTAYNSTSDMASATTSLSFLTTRTMTVNAIPTVIQADGTSKSAITVQVKNEDNNPIVGDQITFVTDAGMVTASAKTDENGKAVASLTSDRRNTIATVKATLAKDPSRFVYVKVEFSGVELTANANPPSISSSGRDSSTITVTLTDAAKNPIVGEPINFSKLQDSTHILIVDSATNTSGEARCKVSGKGTGVDTIRVEAAGATAKAAINYSSNFLSIDTARGQSLVANGRDSTLINITYMQGNKTTPISNATIDASVTLGSMNRDTVFVKRLTLVPSNNGTISFFMKNPSFANTATIFVYARTSSELTSATFKLYFKASKIKRIDLAGTPEVIASNGSKAKITAVAYDSLGNRVKDERISFNMANGPGGGEYLDPPTAITAEDGSAITYLVSGKTPSLFRQVWVTAGDLSALKSDTLKFTIAGPPHAITIRQNIIEGVDYKDGTFGLPCAAIVTDVNGNPVADGTEVTFSLKVSGWVTYRPASHFTPDATTQCYTVTVDTMYDVFPFEDLNDNFRLDPGEDVNSDGVASRGEDRDGDGLFITGPGFLDINGNGYRDYSPAQPGLPYTYPEPYYMCTRRDTSGATINQPVYADYNGNGMLDLVEPLLVNMTDSAYSDSLRHYMAQHHGMNFDFDTYPKNGVADPKTAVSIARTIQTGGGKAANVVLYGQADALRIQIMIWAESQGVRTESPAQVILPVVGGSK